MAVQAPFTSTVGRLLDSASRLLRGEPDFLSAECLAYARTVRPYAVRAERAFTLWLRRVQQMPPDDALANAASVLRWEFAAAAEHLAALHPPADAAKLHQRLVKGLLDAARGSQLLASGYRSTTYGAVCDGQALLADAHAELAAVVAELTPWAIAPAEPIPVRAPMRESRAS